VAYSKRSSSTACRVGMTASMQRHGDQHLAGWELQQPYQLCMGAALSNARRRSTIDTRASALML
jgi:hypothetical protein